MLKIGVGEGNSGRAVRNYGQRRRRGGRGRRLHTGPRRYSIARSNFNASEKYLWIWLSRRTYPPSWRASAAAAASTLGEEEKERRMRTRRKKVLLSTPPPRRTLPGPSTTSHKTSSQRYEWNYFPFRIIFFLKKRIIFFSFELWGNSDGCTLRHSACILSTRPQNDSFAMLVWGLAFGVSWLTKKIFVVLWGEYLYYGWKRDLFLSME